MARREAHRPQRAQLLEASLARRPQVDVRQGKHPAERVVGVERLAIAQPASQPDAHVERDLEVVVLCTRGGRRPVVLALIKRGQRQQLGRVRPERVIVAVERKQSPRLGENGGRLVPRVVEQQALLETVEEHEDVADRDGAVGAPALQPREVGGPGARVEALVRWPVVEGGAGGVAARIDPQRRIDPGLVVAGIVAERGPVIDHVRREGRPARRQRFNRRDPARPAARLRRRRGA